MSAPFTIITSKKRKFEWKKIEQDAFNIIKQNMAYDTLLTYLGFNETFLIHTNANSFQLVAVIIHKENRSLSKVAKLLMPNSGTQSQRRNY